MKRALIQITVLAVVVSCCYVLFASEHKGHMEDKMYKHEKMEKYKMDMSKMCPRCEMTGKCMTSKHMEVTEEGYIIILVGNMLMKYNEELELVKDVELEIDMEQIQEKMKSMMKSCHMCSKSCCMDEDKN